MLLFKLVVFKNKEKDVFYIFLLRNIERVEMCFIKRILDKIYKYLLFVYWVIWNVICKRYKD